ncbi:hypothetical protein ACFWC6_30820 [Micromonospora chalcea]
MTDLTAVPQPGDPHTRPGTCPTCGPGPTEPHPRRAGIVRCGNCKTHLTTPRPRVVITGNACCGGNGFEASCEVCRD